MTGRREKTQEEKVARWAFIDAFVFVFILWWVVIAATTGIL